MKTALTAPSIGRDMFSSRPETLAARQVVGWAGGGPRLMELLGVKLDTDPESEQYKEAYKMVWRLLSISR